MTRNAFIGTLVVGVLACSPPENTLSPTQSPSKIDRGTPKKLAIPTVILSPSNAPAVRITVEVVRTPHTIRQGLMYRQHLPKNSGMLFLMGTEKQHSFWMHNTLIPLDMIFINRDMTIVGIVENAAPMTKTSRRVDAASLYVLEVNGGYSAAHNVSVGTTVYFENIPKRQDPSIDAQ